MGTFYTETIRKDPRFHSNELCKDEALLEPNLRRKVEAMKSDAAGNGHRLVVIETFRAQGRQEMLFNEGKTELEHVGCHGYGVACDLAFLNEDGSVNWSADWSVLGELAKNHSLVWGGTWHFQDKDHVQNCAVSDQPMLFDGTFYPDSVYNALARP